jgi:hypothetical protein
MATVTSDIRVVVDRLLGAEKVPTGKARWVDEHRAGDMRLLYPLLMDGEVSDANLQVIAYPRSTSLRFRLNLLYGRAIWRLDYVDDEEHVNSFNRPDDLVLGPFTCQHYHAWADNRRFATKTSLPERLENARILEANLQTFSNAFRWFCGQTKINISELEIPQLPVSDRML